MVNAMLVLVTGCACVFASTSAGQASTEPAESRDHLLEGVGSARSTPEFKTLEELLPNERTPELWIESPAPALRLSHFSRGEPIHSLEPGQVYIIEMWATWCGPCIAAFPHLASLQEKYGDRVSIIGVNIWEQAEGVARVELVDGFVAEHTEMAYTVAIEEETSMAETWMKPAGRNGIPAAFIVDAKGKIAWMGHPLAIDEPLDQIINGGYDIEAVKHKKWIGHLTSVAYDQMLIAEHENETDRLLDVCKTLVYDAYAESAQPLNAISWRLLGYEDATPGILRVAYDAAVQACELTDWQDWMILDTYALAAFKNGDHESAVKWQNKAIELAPEASKDELRPQLERFLEAG